VKLGSILLLDDNEAIRTSVSLYLGDNGYDVHAVRTLAEAVRALEHLTFDAAVVDYLLPDGTALELLGRWKESGSQMPIILLTGHGSIDLAVRAIRAGAEHFLTKPLELPALLEVVQRTVEGQRAHRHAAATRSRTSRDAIDPFLGESDPMRRLADEARRIARSELPVLLQGETGSGKGVLAAWLHANGPRASEALVDINCAGLSAQLLESELFGHERGAFTGAHAAKAGLFAIADRGTLFLDEMGDLDPLVQPKLLKVLEERRFRRLGGVRDHAVDVRLVTATHIDLAQAVAERRFRSDLWFRVNTLVLLVPPLRERAQDIPALARHIFERLNLAALPELSEGAVRALQGYGWPGNVRELRNVLERAVLLSDKRVLDAGDLRLSPEREQPVSPWSGGALEIVSLEENERRYLVQVLEAKGGRVDEVAIALETPLSSLYQRLKRLGIPLGRGTR
jgi:DNA-binding NtrC family response regulator